MEKDFDVGGLPIRSGIVARRQRPKNVALEAKAANNAEQEAWKWFSRNKGGQKLGMETVGREGSQG